MAVLGGMWILEVIFKLEFCIYAQGFCEEHKTTLAMIGFSFHLQSCNSVTRH
jgi:hypothetical protein